MKRSTVQQFGFDPLWIYTKFCAGACPRKRVTSSSATLALSVSNNNDQFPDFSVTFNLLLSHYFVG
jgi:hypothetical protein